MRKNLPRWLCWTWVWGSVLGQPGLAGTRVPLQVWETTFQGDRAGDLTQVVDGQDTGTQGWGLGPRVTEAHQLILRTKIPIAAEQFNLTLCFLSGKPGSFPGDCQLSGTTDEQPNLDGSWFPLNIVAAAATGPSLELRADGHLTAGEVSRLAGDAVFQLRVAYAGPPLTGFRLEVFPWRTPVQTMLRLGRAADRDLLLTEFRVEAVQITTTNVALQRPVASSHATYPKLPAPHLTDGLPGTFSHPDLPALGSDFLFTIDLGAERTLDHLTLRNRGDGAVPDRWSFGVLELTETASGPPRWIAQVRMDGSHMEVGGVDVVAAAAGQGECRGQYLRISSRNPVAFSPQLAEVEAYEVLVPEVAEARTDGKPLEVRQVLQIPAGSKVLDIIVKFPLTGLPERLPMRWRLRGYHSDWLAADGLTAQLPLPPPGPYLFQAQFQHSDGVWNTAALELRLQIAPLWWQTRWFYGTLVAASMLLALRLWRTSQVAQQRARKVIEDERTRIARDMHDDLGGRLSQLAMLHEMFLTEHPLPETAQQAMQQLTANTRQAVATLDQVVWAVNPRNDLLANVADYLTHCTTSYLNPLGLTCRIEAPSEWPTLTVRAQTRHQLILAYKEALQNLAKHAAARVAVLKLSLTDWQFSVSLTDDGIGLPAELSGLEKDGLDNMQARLERIGGSAEIRAHPDGGTTVEFIITLT